MKFVLLARSGAGKWARPSHPPTDGFAQPSGYGGAKRCFAKPHLRPLTGGLLLGSRCSILSWPPY